MKSYINERFENDPREFAPFISISASKKSYSSPKLFQPSQPELRFPRCTALQEAEILHNIRYQTDAQRSYIP